MINDSDETATQDWKDFAEVFETLEGFPPSYRDERAMMLFTYFSKGMFRQWINDEQSRADCGVVEYIRKKIFG